MNDRNSVAEAVPSVETEMKFVFPLSSIDAVRESLSVLSGLSAKGRRYEKTSIFDSSDGRLFKEDARLRIREVGIDRKGPSKGVEICYKRRLGTMDGIKSEEEVEISFEGQAPRAFLLLERLGYVLVESYERYRETFFVDEAKITLDQFPFASMLEIEGDEAAIHRLSGQLRLEASKSYPRSCDDVYHDLCMRDGLSPKSHISFDDVDMPMF